MKCFGSLLACGLSLGLLVGCTDSKPPIKPKPETGGKTPHDHNHAHESGPHGGTIGEWGGGKYHIEFTVDHDKKESIVYVLGDDVKTPAPVKAEKLMLSINEPKFQVELMAKPLEGEVAGMSSRFVGQNDSLGKVQEFSGSVTTEIDGTPYTGDFKEEAGHDHPKKK